ncbi:MAG: hypothetical protein JW809_01360 [Pirellulales bacterium]|nr:hypothetical protein [Pirellulales bacterium]
MNAQPHPARTGYARLSPRQAWLVLAVLAGAMAFCAAIPLSSMRSEGVVDDPARPGDVGLYRAVIDRVRDGEGYYEALGAELPARGYPTRSVFNWRTPLPLWLLGVLPDDALGRALLGAGVVALAGMALVAIAREEPGATARGVAVFLLLLLSYLPMATVPAFVMPSLWAGVLVGLSVCAFGLRRPGWGVALGVAAAIVRDVAILYPFSAMLWALARRRYREGIGWSIGLACWAAFFGGHALVVRAITPPDALAHHAGWLQCGGAPFVISTAQMNAVLLGLPQWASGPYLVAAAFGLAGWHTAWGERAGLGVCVFLVTFALVGQAFNVYWGFLYGPALCLGVVRFPASLTDAWRATRRPARLAAGGAA